MQWRQTRFDPGMERGGGRVRPHRRARSPPLHHIPFGSISQCVTRIGWIGDDLHEWGRQTCSSMGYLGTWAGYLGTWVPCRVPRYPAVPSDYSDSLGTGRQVPVLSSLSHYEGL